MSTQFHEITIRVRYAETDQMGLVHHAVYPIYFEQGRTEMLRASGLTYKAVEERGIFLVLVKLEVRYRKPARYDDLLTLRTTLARATAVKLDHQYQLLRDGALLTEGGTTLACMDREGRLQRMPEFFSQAEMKTNERSRT